MSLDHILLGMLSEPGAGYDLGREFEQSARMFWFAELSQIYPALKRLEKRGLLASGEEPSSRGPARRVYERTPAGTEELHAWLREPPELRTTRLPYVAQLYFLGELEDPEASVRFVEALRAELEARLSIYEAIEVRHRLEHGEVPALSDVEFHRYAALRAGIHVVKARLAWCEETLAALEERLARDPAAASPAGTAEEGEPAAATAATS